MEPVYGICSVILVMVKSFASQLRRRLMISHRTVDESDKELVDIEKNDVKRLAKQLRR